MNASTKRSDTTKSGKPRYEGDWASLISQRKECEFLLWERISLAGRPAASTHDIPPNKAAIGLRT